MKKYILLAISLVGMGVAYANYETVVYSDNFNREDVGYTVVQPEGVAVIIESNILKLPSPLNNTSGKIFVTGSLSSYKNPFKDMLSHIQADSIVWMWNLRQNYATTTNHLGGFGNNTRGMAVVLAADKADLTQASGYAIVGGGNQRTNYRLVYFQNGLVSNTNLTTIIDGIDLVNPKNRMACKVIYLPKTNSWSFYLSEGNNTSFTDPTEVKDFVLHGSAVDSTLTRTPMTTFGYHINIAASSKVSFNMYVDNFSLRTYTEYKPDTTQPNPPVVVHKLELPQCISSHMVLQRGVQVPVWGWGTAGDTIVAEWTIREQTVTASTIVDTLGNWKLIFPEQTACAEPTTMSIYAQGTTLKKDLEDILVGDVWMASGQSNMEKRMDHLTEYQEYLREAKNYPLIRYCRTSYNGLPTPSDHSKGNPWFICDSANLSLASAVAYVFARELQEQLQVPIGILGAYRGGTELETWMSPMKIDNDPELAFVKSRKASGDMTKTANYPTINYNGQVHPLTPFAIKGFIFYQGESNVKRALEFRFMQGKLIEDWRERWNMGKLPFYFVQLFNVGPTSTGVYEEVNWSDLREQQSFLALDEQTPHTGMAVIIETNEQSKNQDESLRMHPHTKKPVGQRLAWLALKHTYDKEMAADAPSMQRFYTVKDTMFIVFRDVEDGLAIRRDSAVLAGFAIADSRQDFVKALASIVNDSVVAVYSPEVQNPASVRYAWSKDPVCNLINSAGLPVGPFRTDCWASKVAYSIPAHQAKPNTDNTLVCVRVNGEKLASFSNNTFVYNLNADMLGMPYVMAIARHPMSKLTITQVTSLISELESDRTATITVIAEDGTKREFKLIFERQAPASLTQVIADGTPTKVMEKGELLIKHNNKVYTAVGATKQ